MKRFELRIELMLIVDNRKSIVYHHDAEHYVPIVVCTCPLEHALPSFSFFCYCAPPTSNLHLLCIGAHSYCAYSPLGRNRNSWARNVVLIYSRALKDEVNEYQRYCQ